MFYLLAQDDWYNRTTLHPLGVVALLVLSVAALIAPRRYALVPMLIMACFVATAQRVVFATLDFNFLRILILVGWLRVVLRRETGGIKWKTLDTVFVIWTVSAIVTTTLLHTTVPALINRLGLMYDAVGLYFLCRFLVRDWRDIFAFARAAAIVSIPVAAAFLLEKTTGRNMFSIFGGVPEITNIRAGRLRCQGPFTHPILAGYFWAALMPLIAALWWHRPRHRPLVLVGLCACLTVVITCTSATPQGAVIAAVIGAAVFPLRHWMSLVRWGLVVGAITLQLVMLNPIWHLFARVPLVRGSTGWYRYVLIDDFINHFGDWWLIGTESRVGWWAEGEFAITNEFVLQGVEGGLVTLLLFVGIIGVAFYSVGRMCQQTGRTRQLSVRPVTGDASGASTPTATAITPRARLAMGWALGVALFVHCVAFSGVTCFGQAVLVWYVTLGMIGSLTPLGQTRLAIRVKPTEASGHELPLPAQPAVPSPGV